MIDPSEWRKILIEIRTQVSVLLTATSGDNTEHLQSIDDLYAGQPSITSRPIAFPFGMVSQCPPGTGLLVGRLGEHPNNRITLGTFDDLRPAPGVGNTILYNAYGAQVVLDNVKVKIGGPSADEPLVLGNVMLDFLGQLLDAIETLTVTCSAPGVASSPPINEAVFVALKLQFVTLKTLVSQTNFTQLLNTPEPL
jgi:hypothetical protein